MRHWSLLFLLGCAPFAHALDLTHATVVSPQNFSAQEQQAVRVLLEEAEKRSQIAGPNFHVRPPQGPVISILNAHTGPPEGYSIRISDTGATVTGNDARGVLFGIGYLLRQMHMS